MFQQKLERGRQSEGRGDGRPNPEELEDGTDLPPLPDEDDELDLGWGKAAMPDFDDEESPLPVASMDHEKVYAVADSVDSTDATVISSSRAHEGSRRDRPKKKKRPLWVPLLIIAAVLALVAGAWFIIANNTDLFSGDAAARVNGDTISVRELDDRFDSLAAQSPEMFNPDLGGMETTAARMLVLNGMIDDLLLMQEAGVEGISVSDSDVQERIDARIITFPSTEAFEEELAINGLTPQLFREQTRHAMIFVALMEHLVPTDSVSDQEVYDYYHENVDLYTEFAAKRTSHILLPLTDEARGEELLEELQASRNLEEDFAAAAQEYSIDVSNADLGGDADWPRVPDHRHPDYIEAIDDLDVGELSELIRTEVGYFIILVTDERSETVRSLEEVSPGIRDMKLNTLRNEMRTNLVERLRGEADIEILDSAILDAQERGEIFLGNDADVDAYDAANLGEENPPAEDPVLEEE